LDSKSQPNELLPAPMFKQGNRWVYDGRYTNCQGYNIVIVASVYTCEKDGVTEVIDWAAYIGADTSSKEIYAIEYTLKYGNKLSKADAEYFFPFLVKYAYRY